MLTLRYGLTGLVCVVGLSLAARLYAQELTPVIQDGTRVETLEPAATSDQRLDVAATEQPKATPEQAIADDLQGVVYDVDIPLNARVLSYVELFQGRLKGYLEDGLSRGAQYLPMILEVFRAEGLPLDLAYVPLIESAFKPDAVSRAKATGLWQFMRGTALENGLNHDWYIDERADPEKATRAAANYLKTLYGMFGDWHLALASYNGGPGRMQRAMKRSGRADFWKLSASRRYLPRETRDYVPLILAAIIVAKDPLQYGLDVPSLEPPTYETVTLARAVDLRRVAEWTGSPVDAIQRLNPELRRWTTPLAASEYVLRVPEGTALAVHARLAEAAPDEPLPITHYIVKKGDTISRVAQRLKVTRSDLAEANYLSRSARLQAGQALVVPRAPAIPAERQSDGPQPADAGRADAVQASLPIAIDEPSPAPVVHRVQRGDTLFSLARRYGTTVAQIKERNALGSNLLRLGQRLTITRLPALATH